MCQELIALLAESELHVVGLNSGECDVERSHLVGCIEPQCVVFHAEHVSCRGFFAHALRPASLRSHKTLLVGVVVAADEDVDGCDDVLHIDGAALISVGCGIVEVAVLRAHDVVERLLRVEHVYRCVGVDVALCPRQLSTQAVVLCHAFIRSDAELGAACVVVRAAEIVAVGSVCVSHLAYITVVVGSVDAERRVSLEVLVLMVVSDKRSELYVGLLVAHSPLLQREGREMVAFALALQIERGDVGRQNAAKFCKQIVAKIERLKRWQERAERSHIATQTVSAQIERAQTLHLHSLCRQRASEVVVLKIDSEHMTFFVECDAGPTGRRYGIAADAPCLAGPCAAVGCLIKHFQSLVVGGVNVAFDDRDWV